MRASQENNASAAPQKIPIDSRVAIGKLDNGFTYYIQKNSKPEKRVELRLVVNAGSVQEDDDQLGLAHFVEHMCFDGTEHFPKNELIHYLQRSGVKFGPDINAFTSFDETVYRLTLPSDSEEIMKNGLQIMRDWAGSVTFDPVEIDKERGVVTEEWRLGRGAEQRMLDKYIPVLFKGSKYAKRLPIGTKESIQGSSYDVIKRFYRDWYRPDMMALVVVGDIDADKIKQQIQALFSSLKSPDDPRQKEVYPILDNDEPLVSVVSDKENTELDISLAYKTKKQAVENISDYRRELSQQMFVSMLNARLNDVRRQADPPFMNAGSYIGEIWVRPSWAFQVDITVNENGVDRGVKAVLTEMERAKRYGFLQAELDRQKKNIMKDLEKAYQEKDKNESANFAWDYINHFLKNDPIPGIEFRYQYAKDNLSSITLEDVNQWGKKWVTDNNQVVIVEGIDKYGKAFQKKPADLEDDLKWVKTADISPYKENTLGEKLMAAQPAPGKVIKQREIGKSGVYEWKLSNGMTVVLKPTAFKNNEILMSAFSPGGASRFPYSYKLAGNFANSFVSESGVSKFKAVDLDKMLSGNDVRVNPTLDEYFSGFSGGSGVYDMETMFQLVYLYFTQPRFDEEAYKSIVARYSAMYANQLSNPVQYFSNQVKYIRYNNDPETPDTLPVEADWKNLSLEKMKEVYQKSFSNASNFTFSFVGAFTLESIKPLVEHYLGSLPASDKKESFVDNGKRPLQGPLKTYVNRGSDPKSYVCIYLQADTKWLREDAHAFWATGNILQRICIDKLREEMSGVYGFGIKANIERAPRDFYLFKMSIPCAPENTEKLLKATIEVINRLKTEGPTAEEMQKEIATQRKDVELNEKENSSWLSRIEQIYKVDNDFTRITEPYALVDMLTPKLIKEAANKYFTTDKLVVISLYPEGYTPAKAGGGR